VLVDLVTYHSCLSTAGEFDLMVAITMDGDVQLMVTPIEDYLIPELTRLRISFTNEEEERNGVIRNVTSVAAFMNAERIFYQIPRSGVPFQRFRVQVAQLVKGTTGPLVPSDLDSAPIYGEFLNIMMCRLYRLHVWSSCVLVVAQGSVVGTVDTGPVYGSTSYHFHSSNSQEPRGSIMLSLLFLEECRTLWDEHEQAACILATNERTRYKLLSV